jgi:hypothetical protein
MDRDEVKEFHFIAPISNLGSILMHGILSHDRGRNYSIFPSPWKLFKIGAASSQCPAG